MAHYDIREFGLGVVLASDAVSISRCTFYYQLKRIDDKDIIDVVSDIAEKRRTYGFRKIFKRLRQLGHKWNHKRVYRVYCGLKLNLRRKGKNAYLHVSQSLSQYQQRKMNVGQWTL